MSHGNISLKHVPLFSIVNRYHLAADSRVHSIISNEEKKITMMLVFIIIAFFICQCPYIIMHIIFAFSKYYFTNIHHQYRTAHFQVGQLYDCKYVSISICKGLRKIVISIPEKMCIAWTYEINPGYCFLYYTYHVYSIYTHYSLGLSSDHNHLSTSRLIRHDMYPKF